MPPPHSPVRRAYAPICTRYKRDRATRSPRTLQRVVRLSHQRRGSGPPLVLIHGIGSQWQMWEPVIGDLAAGHDVIALDLPGFGESLPLLGQAPSVPELARAVARFVPDLGVERPDV